MVGVEPLQLRLVQSLTLVYLLSEFFPLVLSVYVVEIGLILFKDLRSQLRNPLVSQLLRLLFSGAFPLARDVTKVAVRVSAAFLLHFKLSDRR